MLKKFTKRLAIFGLASCLAAPALAADPATPNEGGVDVQINENGANVKVRRDKNRNEDAATRKVRQGTRMGAYRSSDLLNMTVMNAEGKDLGKINDIVVGTDDGKVRYAAISFGGFLGLGDKMFALPWDALRMKKTDDSTHFVLNVSEEKLKNAPGFDQDNWPDFANADMTGKLDAYYGKERQRDGRLRERANNRERNNADRPNRNRANRDRNADVNETTDATEPSAYASVMRVSKVKALSVYDAQNDNIASIEDVVIDIDEGNVRYVAVSFDDSWGYGEKLFAMPWKALKFQTKEENTVIVINVTQAQMKSATGFESDDWPNFADREWRSKTDDFYLDVPGAKVEVE